MSLTRRPVIVAVAGIASNVGKTTLVCELLARLPGWEAIKITRGHYRSCGKGPECCVSDLLQAEPLIYSGRTAQTDQPQKDTGRYWQAGASNVHWVIVTGAQVEAGLRQALLRVEAPGVIVEGTSFLKYLPADFAVLAINREVKQIKGSARKVLGQIQALFDLRGNEHSATPANYATELADWLTQSGFGRPLPVYGPAEVPNLVAAIKQKLALAVCPAD